MKITWWNEKLRSEALKMRRFREPEIEVALKKDLTDDFLEELMKIGKSKAGMVTSTFAPQRWGKSFVNIYNLEIMAEERGVELTIDNVFFRIWDLLKSMKSTKFGDIKILDEQDKLYGAGSNLIGDILMNQENTIMKKGIVFSFISPKFVEHTWHWAIEPFQRGGDKPLDINIPAEHQWKYTRSFIYDYTGKVFGCISTSTPRNKKFLKEYEEKKDRFIESQEKMLMGGHHQIIIELMNDLLKRKNFMEDYVFLPTKKLKEQFLKESSEGFMLTEALWRTLVDKIDYEFWKKNNNGASSDMIFKILKRMPENERQELCDKIFMKFMAK